MTDGKKTLEPNPVSKEIEDKIKLSDISKEEWDKIDKVMQATPGPRYSGIPYPFVHIDELEQK